ncbi:MAG: hypothetical protein RBU21_12735 [FCB group bacterium]|jgi:hypothetical protein|nr:hypothetical protein [FCB group bacterium]
MESSSTIYTFEIDSANVISAVSDNWDAFALENEGEEACAGRVLGRPWWEFVTGNEVRMLYTGLLRRVRETKLQLTLPFRCDGPTVRRYMTMTVAPRPDDAVLFSCALVREEPRKLVPLLSREAPRASFALGLCGWCGKARVDGVWMEVEEMLRKLKLFEREQVPTLSHGICPACEAKFSQLAGLS